MDNNNGSSGSETIKVGDVDITINIDHHDGGEHQQSGYTAQPAPVYAPPVRKRRNKKNIISVIVLCFCAVGIISSFWSYSTFTRSTHERRPLGPGAVTETGYFTDKAGWIDNEKTFLTGLKEFYKTTGVQPYVYITASIDGSMPTTGQLENYTDRLFHELFSDEGHMLLVFLPSGSGYMEDIVCGTQAATVIDAEAENILRDYLDYNYSFNSKTNSEVLSDTFASAASHMMIVTYSPWISFFVFGAIAAIVVILYVRRRKRECEAREAMEAEQTEAMLKIPLEKFGDPEVEELAKKYEDKT
jgi:hypothetical protein